MSEMERLGKMKKLICLLLCLMMIVPAAVSTAGSAIDRISVTLTIPKAGTKPTGKPIVSIPSNAPYEIESSYWVTYENGHLHDLDKSTVFTAGKEYFALVYLITSTIFDPNASMSSNVSIVKEQSWADKQDAAVILRFKVSREEKISLKKIKGVKLKALSKGRISVTWKKLTKKQRKKIQKIQIQYSTDKTFKTYKTKWAKKGATSVKISGLKKNTKYYIRIRAYKKSGGVIYVSKWVTKNKKTKKK